MSDSDVGESVNIAQDGRRGRRGHSAADAEGSLGKDILYLLLKIGLIVLAFVLVFTFLFGVFRNAEAAMVPAIKDGDLVVFYRLDKDYVLSDTVVLEFEGEKQVRRVVATAGDTVDITDQGLMVNGALQQELEIYSSTKQYEEGIRFPITLSEGQVFVLGDARENATDSRIYGAVEIKDTLGKVITILRRRNI
ncbi:signal peptidase I [Christensenella tenuis]|uniref:Signal peptidase I n=1 Tax=Christensenella tenuis TaxID=2763033 RepID=A0ABR7EE47_9FIRM|nr:signal peptidase I [Christensenella tenuis]MBC5648052.1 signal peptidase I [Christensenella tenuis]